MALADLLNPQLRGGRHRGPRTPARRAQSETRDLSVPERRAVADGLVRLQAAAERKTRDGAARGNPSRGQRLTAMSGNQASLPLVGSPFKFAQHGQSGAWVSELLPRTAEVVDDLCFIKSMYTEAINHGPGVTYAANRFAVSRTAQHGRLAQLRLGSRQRGPARLCRAGHQGQRRPAAGRRGCGAVGFCPRSFKACGSARARTRCCT